MRPVVLVLVVLGILAALSIILVIGLLSVDESSQDSRSGDATVIAATRR